MFSFISNTLFRNERDEIRTNVSLIVDNSRPMFVFGTLDTRQLAINDFLHSEVEKRNSKINPYTYCFSDKVCRPRRAKRTAKFVHDTKYSDRSICSICQENNSCILLKPCNHAGLCNQCSLKIFNKSAYKQLNNSIIISSIYPDPRFTSNALSIEDDLHQIQLSLQLCPWCKTRVNSIEYIYIV